MLRAVGPTNPPQRLISGLTCIRVSDEFTAVVVTGAPFMRKALRAFAPSALFIEALFLVPLPASAAQDVLVAPRLAVVAKGP